MHDELLQQIKDVPEIDILFPREKFIAYAKDEPIRNTIEHPDLYVNQIRYYTVYRFLKDNYPDIFENNTTILNVGDVGGLLFEAIGKKGTSLNINPDCVAFMKNKGIEAIVGDVENLKLSDSSFDFIFSFQCLEHVPNPLRALNELGRVARKAVFISIPYVNKTIIYNMDYWTKMQKESWQIKDPKAVDGHIFEFSTEDYKNILSYTNLDYKKSFPINYFDDKTYIRRLFNKVGTYFNFFVLVPKK
ncbi:MAG: class I SAM-dependent methyltransferase [Candidatus Omnitrophota bacterium]